MICASARLQMEQFSSGSEFAKAKTVKLRGAAAATAAVTWSSDALGGGKNTWFGGSVTTLEKCWSSTMWYHDQRELRNQTSHDMDR